MNFDFDIEKAEAGYVIVLDPAPEAESEDVEYFYLTSDKSGSKEPKDSSHFDKPKPQKPGSASGEARFLSVVSNITGASIFNSRAQYEGFHIAHYQVERAIGRGGMGDVYLARDLRLGRPVAIKLLRADYHPTEERVRCIQDEARAVCALNHPNIVTIYEIGEVDGAPFIVSEFIEGDTLRQILPPTGIRPDRALEITIQIACALSFAHQMGIVHRDVKPENVMVRSDGYVKVLDFGLAKLSDALEDRDLQDASLQAPPDVVMGTISYMSPEQVRGQIVDERSDVFSLGIVLYELVTGRKPFDGKSQNDILSAILANKPAPIADYKPDETTGFQHIVNKALRKNRDERYATMNEMIRDLRDLKDEVALRLLQKRITTPLGSSPPKSQIVLPAREVNKLDPIAPRTPGSKKVTRKQPDAYITAELEMDLGPAKKFAKRATRSAQTYASKLINDRVGVTVANQISTLFDRGAGTSRTKIAFALIAACILLVCALAARQFFFINQLPPSDQMRLTKLTASGQIGEAAISPDGGLLVFSQKEDGGKQGLWLRQVNNDRATLLVSPQAVEYKDVTFSRDGNFLYFLSKEKDALSNPALYRMVPEASETGRASLQKLPVNVDSSFGVSADGKRIAFIRTLANGEKDLVVTDLATGQERQVVARKEPNTFQSTDLVWSPDDESIICVVVSSDRNGRYESLVAIRLEDGQERLVSSVQWLSIGKMVWLRKEDGLVLIGSTVEEPLEQLWRVTNSGKPERVTNDPNSYTGLSMTKDGRTIAAIQVRDPLNIWIALVSDLTRVRQLTYGSGHYFTPSWLPDGNIVTDSDANGAGEIRKLTMDDGKIVQLTSKEQQNFSPVSTPDGQYLIVQSMRSGRSNLWRVGPGAENAVQLTKGEADNGPRLSPDGKWVFYESLVTGKWTIWKVPIEDGNPEQLVSDSRSNFNSPALSPDSQWLAVRQSDLESNHSRIVIVPAAGGRPAYVFNLPPTAGGIVRWGHDGQGVTYVDNRTGASEIWYQSLAGGQPRQLTSFGTEKIFSFNWSNDGRYLMVTRGAKASDAVLISSVN